MNAGRVNRRLLQVTMVGMVLLLCFGILTLWVRNDGLFLHFKPECFHWP